MNVQQRYNGVFDNITISEEKRKEIEAAMRETTVVKKKIRLKKYAVIAVSLVMVLSMGIIVNAATDGELLNKIANIVGIKFNGEEVSKEDYADYIDENGDIIYNIMPEKLPEGGQIAAKYDDDGNIISYSIVSNEDPRSNIGWYWNDDGEKRYFRIPEKAELLEELKLVDIDGARYADMSGSVEELPRTIPFSYEGEYYTMVLIGEYNPCPITKIYKGIVEYDPTEEYEGYEEFYLE